MKLNGKPVIVAYDVSKLSGEDWKEIFSGLHAEGFDGIYLSDGGLQDLDMFQGFYYYAVNGISNLAGDYMSISQSIKFFGLLTDEPQSKLWVATIQPGFDNTPLINDPATPLYGKKAEIIDRANGDFYRNTWDAAIASDPGWIFITTWNEWQENTVIEPSQNYADNYLQLTHEYISKWKSK